MGKKKTKGLSSLLEFYADSVAEHDEKGWAEFYKSATEGLLDSIKKDCPVKVPLNFDDIDYSDGYFIFGRGTNSTVSFHIREIPGWLFGIWWDEPKEETNEYGKRTNASYEWFAQYEEEIDKFKPSSSKIGGAGGVVFSEGQFYCSTYEFANNIAFMYEDPELAFCRHYLNWDYNTKYHSRSEAKKEFAKYKKWLDAKNTLTPLLDQRYLDFAKSLFNDLSGSGDMLFVDRGENWTPRYEMIAEKSKVKGGEDAEDGSYAIEQFYGKKSYDAMIKEERACQKIANKNKFYWSPPVDSFILIVNHKKFLKIKEDQIGREKANGQ